MDCLKCLRENYEKIEEVRRTHGKLAAMIMLNRFMVRCLACSKEK